MSQIGTVVTNVETPGATNAQWDSGNLFLVGLADWGPSVGPVTLQTPDAISTAVGPRSGTNTTLYDSLDVFFREGAQQAGATAFVRRVVGPGASAAALTLLDAGGSATVVLYGRYVGNYGNQIQVAVANSGPNVSITVTDTYGNSLAASPALTTRAAIVAWASTVPYLSAYAYVGASLPVTSVAASLTGGTDDRAHATLASWTSALATFSTTFGPGQVAAPGVTNTTMPGIWAALATHALANNRVAIGDMDDGIAASVQVSNLGAQFQSQAVGPIAFWAGNLVAPGVAPLTSRSIPPSVFVAAKCALADSTGNPNLACAGQGFPALYCTGSFTLVSGTSETYSPADVNTLNSAGINTFATRFGVFENFGFVSSIPPTIDAIYWQFNHARLRMALTAAVQQVAEPFLFGQLDGQGSEVLAFDTALTSMLAGYQKSGALYGSLTTAFSIDTGPQINTPATLQAGNLGAKLSVRMSPFAELIPITINSVPITTSVPVGNSTTVVAP